MTKPKKIKPVRPVLAWCVVDSSGELWPNWTNSNRAKIKDDAAWSSYIDRIIRVEIRPAPKRRKPARRKS